MSLTSYKEVRPWARSIREMVVERKMPPWFADPHYGEYANDCRLTQKDIETISAWAESGAAEGDAKDLPAPASFIDGWNIGKPDVMISMPEKFDIPGEGVIPYKFFIVPTGFKEDRYVQLAEIRPGDRAHVHHAEWLCGYIGPMESWDGQRERPELLVRRSEQSGRLQSERR